ncbi:MAG TPA: mechanosensitive ion channel domain-containing protein [Opitutaceae bacterium]|jgi:small-conductance mechanosensitive channel
MSAPIAQLSPEAAHWAARLHDLAGHLPPLLRDWAQRDVLPYVSGLQLLLSGTVLAAIAALAAFAHLYTHRALRRATDKEPSPAVRPVSSASFLRLAYRQARPPLILFVSAWALYFALSIALFRIPMYGDALLAILAWAKSAALVIDLFWFLFRMIDVLETELTRWTRTTTTKWDDVFVAVALRALRLVLPLIALMAIVSTLGLPEHLHAGLQEIVSILLIGFIGFVLCEIASTAETAIKTEYNVHIADNLSTRKIQTQVGILKKIFITLVVLVTLASMLTVFAPVRSLGRSILASAGVAGIVLGIAAQKSLGTLLAGIQIAFSQPIRLDDVVIVEGEWGRIEEITLTYVVVAIWDLRRMVLPITYFIEKPFQNWTRSNAALLGTVFLYLDYTAPIADLRAELDRILEESKLWDKKVKGLQVTDAKDSVIEVRILASGANSGVSFDLRCEIREKMISFVQSHCPTALPRTRGSLEIARITKEPLNPKSVPRRED